MSMKLSELLKSVVVVATEGALDLPVEAIRFDSRAVQAGDLFVAVKGAAADGHQFIDKALENGASALVYDSSHALSAAQRQAFKVLVAVENSAEALGQMAANFYGNPSREMKLIGITGTNGKTTTTTLLYQLFSRLGYTCGLIGTVANRIGDALLHSTHTTPDALRLQALFRQMLEAGCTHVFMEVSSHAIHQRRIAGAHFAGAVFTNLTHDHLDYHGTFAEYRDAKKMLFDQLPSSAFALTNADDKNGMFMLQNTAAQKQRYGLKNMADFKAKIIDNSLLGLYMQFEDTPVHTRLIGEFNAYNLNAAYAVAQLLGEDKIETLTALSALSGAEGRFEHIAHNKLPDCIGIVDYAHTPDALEKVLETIQKLKKPNDKVITVVGCGGDRDKSKRPVMAQIAARMSEQVILTSDNPRTENPLDILADMEAGLDSEQKRRTLTIENREQAIKTACRLLGPNSIVLVAGKGHEKYQEIQGVKHPFDDLEILQHEFDFL